MKIINKNSGIEMNKEITNQKTTPEKLLCPKAGTATSSPTDKTASQSNMNIVNVMLWMKRNAYEDPTIKTIRLYYLRHFKALTEYHKTKDLLYIKQLLGHKDLRTTLRYTQLLENLGNDEYHCRTAKSIQEATQLIENGFQYVTEIDGAKLFKKASETMNKQGVPSFEMLVSKCPLNCTLHHKITGETQ